MNTVHPIAVSVAVVSTGVTLSACGYLSAIDVCDRGHPEERELNALTEGAQMITSPSALGPLPSGGALLVFRSDRWGSPSREQTVARGVLVDESGAPLPTCQESSEYTYVDVRPDEHVVNTMATIAPPATDADTGLVAFARKDEAVLSTQIYGQFILPSGCKLGSTQAFPISSEVTGFPCEECDACDTTHQPETQCVGWPSVVRIGARRFVTFWISSHVTPLLGTFRLMGRVVDADFLGPLFVSNFLSPEGDPVSLMPYGRMPGTVTALAISERTIALAWREYWAYGPLRTLFQLRDDRLAPTTEEIELGSTSAESTHDWQTQMAVHDERILVAWSTRDTTGRARIFARIVDRDGVVRPSPLTGAMEPFPVSTTDCGNEAEVSVTALSDSRAAFLVAWRADACDSSGTSIRGVLLDRDGKPVFANRACGARDFQLNDLSRGDQDGLSLAALRSGKVAVAWTDHGLNGPDRSVAAIRGTVFSISDLVPVKE